MGKTRIESSSGKGERRKGFMTSLAYAFMEWILMFLLFLNGVFTYLIIKFARYCNLPLPCLLCSRLDNVLGKEKVEYFQDLFCRNHKTEMSSLVLCHAHCKLVDVHKMCETCLFSFATINKSNSETYRLLVGKLGDNPECEFEEGLWIDGKKHANKMRRCCCCLELWRPKSYQHDLLRTCSFDHETLHLDRELSLDIGHDTYQHLRSIKEVDVRDESQMHCVGDTELKVASHTESELMINEYGSNIAHYEMNVHKSYDSVPGIITLVDDFASETLIPEPSVLVAHPQLDDTINASNLALESTVSMHGLEELNWHHVDPKTHSNSRAELITFDDQPFQDVRETVVEHVKESEDFAEVYEVKPTLKSDDAFAENSEVKHTILADNDDYAESSVVKHTSLASNDDLAKSSELKSTLFLHKDDLVECSNVKHTSTACNGDLAERSEVKHTSTASNDYLAESSEVKHLSSASDDDCADSSNIINTSLANNDDNEERSEVEDRPIATDEEGPKETVDTVSNSQAELNKDADLQSSRSLDFGDAYNIAISNKRRYISSDSFGDRTVNNSAKISEDLKQLLSQISRGTDLPSFDMSPRVSRNFEELKTSDSSSTGMQMLQKRFSLERNESGLESLDGSVSEVEGESTIDRLKRQIEHDKKLLYTLYKELEEERNASAIAANQAMAMITRLQEEKATLHMDASQYLRMMEEQAEYDMEALQNCNDLLSDREIEIQALEAELEHYRSKYPDEAALLAKSQPYYSMERNRSFSRNFSIPKSVEGLRSSFRDQMKSSFLERENERPIASDLSNKLKELSENDTDSENVNDDKFVHREDTELRVEELDSDEDLKEGPQLENNASSNQKEGSKSEEILPVKENHVSSLNVHHDAMSETKSSPKSLENQHKEWHIVEEVDLEEDKGKGVLG